MKVLSTKILSETQKELFKNTGIQVIDFDAISIQMLDFESPQVIKNGIFTSQNGVQSISGKNLKIENTFCVGERTRYLLLENGEKVIKMFNYGSELGDFIQKNYKNEEFYFFCGNRRRDEIPSAINNSKNTLFEIKTYKTELNTVKFEQKWDGILFFSPSGVESFSTKNCIENTPVFCIGNTTASEAKLHSKNYIYIAEETTVESVIDKAIKTLK